MIKINLQEIKNGKKNRNESKIEFIYVYTRVNIRPIDLQSGTDSTIWIDRNRGIHSLRL